MLKWMILIVGSGCAIDTPQEPLEPLEMEDASEADVFEEEVVVPETFRYTPPPPAPTVSAARAMSRLHQPLSSQDRQRAEQWNIPDSETWATTALVLARIFVSESGWDSPQDAKAIYQVFRTTRRSDETLMGIMRRHSHVATLERQPYNQRGRWLVGLTAGGTRPAGFPARLHWRDYRARWQAVLKLARDLMRGAVHYRVCNAPVIAWGGIMDDHIAERRGLSLADCGDTRNHFWFRP